MSLPLLSSLHMGCDHQTILVTPPTLATLLSGAMFLNLKENESRLLSLIIVSSVLPRETQFT